MMSIGEVSNKQSGPSSDANGQQEQKKEIKKIEREVWSIECTVDQLLLDLCAATVGVDCSEDDNRDQSKKKTLTIRKYYHQAGELIKWIPIARPVPPFVINASDLSPKVVEELETRIDDLSTFAYILNQAVGHIFENIDFQRYHLSIARNLKVRVEP